MSPSARPLMIAAAALAVMLAGCKGEARNRVGYYLDPEGGILNASHVVLLPLENQTDYPGVEQGMTDALFQAVQGRRLFHLEMVRPEPGDGGEAVPSGHKFTLKDLAQVRRTFGADAVLVGCISQAQPYPRTKIGLYLRLLDLKRGQLLWAVDHVWDAADDHTQRRMEAFFRREMGDGSAPFQWQLATLSPRVFQKFVAWEIAETLPGRPLPETPEVDPQSLLGGNFRKNLGF